MSSYPRVCVDMLIRLVVLSSMFVCLSCLDVCLSCIFVCLSCLDVCLSCIFVCLSYLDVCLVYVSVCLIWMYVLFIGLFGTPFFLVCLVSLSSESFFLFIYQSVGCSVCPYIGLVSIHVSVFWVYQSFYMSIGLYAGRSDMSVCFVVSSYRLVGKLCRFCWTVGRPCMCLCMFLRQSRSSSSLFVEACAHFVSLSSQVHQLVK